MDKQFAIFDMDGTLIDSMVFWKNLATEYLTSKGVRGIPADILERIKPMTMSESASLFQAEFGLTGDIESEMNIKINGDILTPEQEDEFYRTFGNITDGISVERTIEYWPKYNEMKVDFDESVSLLGGKSREVQVCPYVFYEMCINSDATYSLCRFDWNHAMILDQHVGYPPTPKKIWDSIVLWRFQEQFLRKERKLMTVLSCPKCGILKQGVPEDLDEFAEEILEEM